MRLSAQGKPCTSLFYYNARDINGSDLKLISNSFRVFDNIADPYIVVVDVRNEIDPEGACAAVVPLKVRIESGLVIGKALEDLHAVVFDVPCKISEARMIVTVSLKKLSPMSTHHLVRLKRRFLCRGKPRSDTGSALGVADAHSVCAF